MSIDSQVILKITITQGSEGDAAHFPFVNFRCHSFKTFDLLLRVFLLKRKKTVTQGRTRTTKPDLSYPNLSPLHNTPQFRKIWVHDWSQAQVYVFFSPLKLSMNFGITLQCLKSIVWRKSKTHIALAKSIYYILSNIGQPLAQPQ